MCCSFRLIFPLCAVAAAAIAVSAQEAKRPELTARELFYNAGSDPAPKSKPPVTSDASKTVAKKKSSKAPVTQQASNPPAQSTNPPAQSTPSGGSTIIPVSDGGRATAPAPSSGTALGLKYTILRLSGREMEPVAPNAVFHAGDKIQFSIETNAPGYLYIVSKGSSGTWMPEFPSPEIKGGDNHVEGFHTYIFPAKYRYVFDHQPGEEKVFIIFSRDPKPDFEQLVYTLQGGETKAEPTSRPVQPDRQTHVLRASIDDVAVGRLHGAYSRDLVIERIGEDERPNTPESATQEKAVYVVNPSGSPDSALMADLHLVHQ
jgi:hypothetical protein